MQPLKLLTGAQAATLAKQITLPLSTAISRNFKHTIQKKSTKPE